MAEEQELETLLAKYGRRTETGEWIANVEEHDNSSETDDADRAEDFENADRKAAVLESLEERLGQVKAKIKELESSPK